MEYPVPPQFDDVVLGALPTFSRPLPPAVVIPTFTGILPLEPESTALTSIPFVYQAYASVIQSDLDDDIIDLTDYRAPDSTLLARYRLVKEKVQRTYHQKRQEILKSSGKSNLAVMPGHVMRQLSDLGFEERWDLNEELLKIVENNVNVSLETIETALKVGLDSNAVQWDSNHKIQVSSFEATSAVVDAGLKAAALKAEAYNKKLSAVEAEIQQKTKENEARLKELTAYGKTLESLQVEAKTQTLLMNAYKAEVAFEVENARLDLIQYEAYIADLELEKLEAEVEVARAELTLAQTNVVTAEYEVRKSRVKVLLSELEKYRVQTDLAKSALETQKAKVDRTKMEVSAAIDLAQEQYQEQRDLLTMAREDLQTAITQAEIAVTQEEKTQTLRVAVIALQNAQAKLAAWQAERFYARATRVETERLSLNNLRSKYISEEALTITEMTNKAISRKEAMVDAAVQAANAKVRSDFYRIDGGTASPP